jgi:membrane protein DedA with SNARE-associated domain
MNSVSNFFVQYEYAVLFFGVLLEQFGVPLPSAPLLLAAGTLSVAHPISLTAILFLVLAACLLADSFWFLVGLRYGAKALRFLCRYTLETSSCVLRQSQ